MVIVLLALTVSTGCLTAARVDSPFTEIMISQIPDLPDFPEWPDVSWAYENGKYYLTETDVDKVLDYLENGVPRYGFEIKQYKEQLRIVLDGISSM